jgi:hypothetical protein
MNGVPESFEAQWKINVPLAAKMSNFVILCTAIFVFYIILKINIDYCISLKSFN